MSLAIAVLLSACAKVGSDVDVTDAVYRAPLGGGDIGVAYLTIQSRKADRIIGMESPMAQTVEMHETVLTGTSSTMQRRKEINLPANEPLIFAPGGLHLMIFGPEALENDATFPLTVRLESGKVIQVDLAQWKGDVGG